MKFLPDRKFIGSSIALIVGVLSMAGALVNPSPTVGISDGLPGLFMILGAVAYQSAKKRKLQLVENTRKRRILEFLALVLIALLILLGPNVPQLIQNGDILTLVIFAFAVIAYLFARPGGIGVLQKYKKGEPLGTKTANYKGQL